MAHITVADEQYQFTPEVKKKVYYLLGAGVVLFIIGLALAMFGGSHDEAGSHAATTVSHEMVASLQDHAAAPHAEDGEHHGSSIWLKRTWAALWTNNMYFVGLAIIGLFFVAVQYASSAGWSAGILRVPLAMAQWLPIAGILTLVLWFLIRHDVFHWTHSDLYVEDSAGFDAIINGKGPYFFWPLASGSFPLFYLLRMVLFFGLWYWFFVQIRKNMLAEDLDPSTSYWFRNRSLSAWFLVFFAVSSSVAAWDWIMSIDTHWFSTMFGWYVFSSWWVTGLAFITLIVANLKTSGYLKIVNANHLHDLGKFVFAFSIFWTYIWFGQFLLIYYANIPEETVYFIERMKTSPYAWIFYANLILNFVLPLLLFMTRDSKRHLSTLKLVCPIVLIGHWFDFYNMVTPAVVQEHGGVGFLEIGATLIFLAAFFLVMYNALARIPLIGRNHPMLEESLHHHI
ncbi:MAG: quinol:cytochrome C oxidoreductase [Cyclobacteriaceae bacterium]|nr:quinol:cytochrome C oxidoreductase [Cyclobacteriaceae bacterium]